MVFLIKMDGYQKLCDTNKNVTKMGVIIKRVYCVWLCIWNQIYEFDDFHYVFFHFSKNISFLNFSFSFLVNFC
jgi:hypothetical protein